MKMPNGMEAPSTPPIAAVLFDLDGTLVDTKALYLEAYRRTLSDLLGRSLADEEILASQAHSESGFLKSFAPENHYHAAVERFHSEYRALHGSMCGGLYDGVLEMLETLRQRGLPVGIVTGKSRRGWEVTCSAFQLGAFDVLLFDDDVASAKPSPHGLLIAAERLGMTAGQVAYVGDSPTDLEAARAAGMLPVAAVWSKTPATRARLDRAAVQTNARISEHPSDVVAALGL